MQVSFNEAVNPVKCYGCKKDIWFNPSRKSKSGKMIPQDYPPRMLNGPNDNQDHDCDAKYQKQDVMTSCLCGSRYNRFAFGLCPNCFVKVCRQCGHERSWRNIWEDLTEIEKTYIKMYYNIDHPLYYDKKKEIEDFLDAKAACPKCGCIRFDIFQTKFNADEVVKIVKGDIKSEKLRDDIVVRS